MEKDEMLLSSDFGKMLKKLRKSKGMTLMELSNKTGISASYLNRLEKSTRRAPGFTKIVKIAGALGVEVSTLVGSELKVRDGEPVSISELFFNNTVENNDIILTSEQKEILCEIIESILLIKWDRSSFSSDLQLIVELVSDLKELQ